METKEIQQKILQNKLAHGFNTTDMEKEFLFLYGEVAESVQAYKFEAAKILAPSWLTWAFIC